MTSTDQSMTRLIHLVQQLCQKRRLTVRQAAAEIGVPRSSLARHLAKGRLPLEFHGPVIRWIAGQLGVHESQVACTLADDAGNAAPVALTEMLHGEFLRLGDFEPRDIATRLTSRWPSAQASIFCPTVPPLFLLPSAIRRLLLRVSENDVTPNVIERIRRLHSSIASRIWLFAESLPKQWELILSHRAMSALSQTHGGVIGAPELQELAEIWQHDLQTGRRLQIRVMPDIPDAHAVERHFGDAATVVLVDGVFRWKESANHQQVTVVECADNPSLLRWDRQILDVARTLAMEAATTSPQSIEQVLRVRLNDREIQNAIDVEHRRRAA